MSKFILDTDHVSLWLQGSVSVGSKTVQHPVSVAITVITVQELFNGWVIKINDPKQAEYLVKLYTKLWMTVNFLKSIRILNFDAVANTHYQQLLKKYPPLRKNRIQKDVRIAAISLSTNSVLVTRNQRDFLQVPDLTMEDWTQD
jgi:tRNA(fMet)-specific endonuclease VapC